MARISVAVFAGFRLSSVSVRCSARRRRSFRPFSTTRMFVFEGGCLRGPVFRPSEYPVTEVLFRPQRAGQHGSGASVPASVDWVHLGSGCLAWMLSGWGRAEAWTSHLQRHHTVWRTGLKHGDCVDGFWKSGNVIIQPYASDPGCCAYLRGVSPSDIPSHPNW